MLPLYTIMCRRWFCVENGNADNPTGILIHGLHSQFQGTSLLWSRFSTLLFSKECLLTFALEETLTRVGSYATEGIKLAWWLEGQLQKLNKFLTLILALMRDAARRPVTDESVKLWLDQLQDIAYDADDILDDFAYEILRKVQQKGKGRDLVSLHNPVAFRWNMGQKVKKINGALDEIQKLASSYGLAPLQHAYRAPEVSWDSDRETDSSLGESEVVVGREDDVFKSWIC